MRGIACYQNTRKNSASPAQIVLMLLQTAVQRLTRASEAGSVGGPTWFKDLHHAREIFLELKNGLNYKAAPALCARLSGLYDWCIQELVRAGREHDTQPVLGVLQATTTLLEGWNTVIYSAAR